MKKREISRRQMLIGGGGVLVVAGLGTWGITAANSGDDNTGGGGGGADPDAREAPMLAALVAQGKLPKLADRLPAKPLVVETVAGVGQYGGTWHTVAVGVEDAESWMLLTIYYDNIVAWDPAFKNNGAISDVKPNLAESFTSSDDGTEYEFTLREGIKWSDGEPFTADDVVFAVNDIQVDPDLTPAPSARFKGVDGSPASATKVDDLTVKITFPTSNGLFLQGMCSAGGYVLAAPRHYLEQFHGKYGAAGSPVETWTETFSTMNDPFANPDRPTLTGWLIKTGLGGGAQAVVERNPYYWKTDPDGRQLPYLDEVVYSIVSDPEVALAQAINGQVDITSRTINTTSNKPVLAENRNDGDFDFYEVKTGQMNNNLIMFNQTSADPVKREIFSNRDFRVGLSYAIDRQEILDTVYAGQGEPWQPAPRPDSPWYDEDMAKQYTEFDVDKANSSLDDAGYPLQGDTRVGPDGNPIVFVVIIATTDPASIQAFEFITRYWAEVGVTAQVQTVDETLFFERVTAGAHDVAVTKGEGGDNPILYPYRYIPTQSRGSSFGPAWAKWFETKGEEGEEPPETVRGWLDSYRDIQATTDADEALGIMKDILAGVRDEFQTIGTGLPIPGYGIVKNNFHNVPESVPGDLTFPNLGGVHPEQFFTS